MPDRQVPMTRKSLTFQTKAPKLGMETKIASLESSGLRPELAFYYPGPMWHSAEWIKNLLLFFDGVALLVPDYMRNRPEEMEPFLASPLLERGLLHIIEPETVVDKAATEKLAEAMVDIIASGMLDALTSDKTEFHELSMSRLGYVGDFGLAQMILDELKSRGLARESEDGVSIPMHPLVRSLVLVLLAQILRGQLADKYDLSPATDRPQLINALTELLSVAKSPSSAHVVSFDLETVGVDLARIPIDEVLDFREKEKEHYRTYATAVRRFVRELSSLPEEERQKAFDDRQREITGMASKLRDTARKAWKKPASFALSVTGAFWRLSLGDPLGASIAAGAAATGYTADSSPETGAYSYLFRAHGGY